MDWMVAVVLVADPQLKLEPLTPLTPDMNPVLPLAYVGMLLTVIVATPLPLIDAVPLTTSEEQGSDKLPGYVESHQPSCGGACKPLLGVSVQHAAFPVEHDPVPSTHGELGVSRHAGGDVAVLQAS